MSEFFHANYFKVHNLRLCAIHEYYFSRIDQVEQNFDVDQAIGLINEIIGKFGTTIEQVGKLQASYVIIHSEDIKRDLYDAKTEQDILDDLEYMRDCVLVDALVRAGHYPSVPAVIRAMNKKV